MHRELTMYQTLPKPFKYIISFNSLTLWVCFILSILEIGKPRLNYSPRSHSCSCRTGIQIHLCLRIQLFLQEGLSKVKVRGFDGSMRESVTGNGGMGMRQKKCHREQINSQLLFVPSPSFSGAVLGTEEWGQ